MAYKRGIFLKMYVDVSGKGDELKLIVVVAATFDLSLADSPNVFCGAPVATRLNNPFSSNPSTIAARSLSTICNST